MSNVNSKYEGLNNSQAIQYFDETLVYTSKRPQTSFVNQNEEDERMLSLKPMQCEAFKDKDASKTSKLAYLGSTSNNENVQLGSFGNPQKPNKQENNRYDVTYKNEVDRDSNNSQDLDIVDLVIVDSNDVSGSEQKYDHKNQFPK